MILPANQLRRRQRVESHYDWPDMVAAGWTAARQEDCYKLTRVDHEITVNLPMGEVWHKYSFEHSRNALLVEEFRDFDGPALEHVLLRFTRALDKAVVGGPL